MDRVPLEVIVRHASREVGNFFAEQVEKERREGKVAILVEDFTNSLYFMRCDKNGYPDYHHFRYMTFDSLNLAVLQKGEIPSTPISMTVEEVSIMIEKPLISQNYDYNGYPIVFLWKGRRMSSRKIPLEKLNVSELQKIAQQAILNREGLVIDEAMSNKIYK